MTTTSPPIEPQATWPAAPAVTPQTVAMLDPWRPQLAATVRVETTPGSASRHLIYDSESGRYCELTAEAAELARVLDGTHTFGELAGDAGAAARENLHGFLVSLIQLGFLDGAAAGEGSATAPRGRARRRSGWTRLEYPVTGLAPLFAALRPLARALFSPASAVVFVALLVAGGWALTLVAGVVWSDATRTPTPGVVVGTFVAILLLVVVHEMAHGLALTRFGGRVDRAGVMLIYLLPAAFCDLSDAYRLPGRWRRVVVALAGIAASLVAVAGCALALRLAGSGGTDDVRQLLAVLVVLNAMVVVVNLIPFIRFDGYWALVGALDAPNLRARAMAAVGAVVWRLIEGRPHADVGTRTASSGSSHRWALLAYGAGCWATPSLLVAVALGQWSALLGTLGRWGALAWFVILGLSAVIVARAGRRRVRTLAGRPRRQVVRASAATVLVAAAAVATAVLLVSGTAQGEHLAHHLWTEPLHQILTW